MGLVVLGPVSNKTCTQWNRLRFSICATEQMLSMQEIQLASAMDAWLLHREVIFGQLVNHQKLSNLKSTVVPLHAFIIPFIPITAWLWWSVGLGNCIYEPPSKTWSLPKKNRNPRPASYYYVLLYVFCLVWATCTVGRWLLADPAGIASSGEARHISSSATNRRYPVPVH